MSKFTTANQREVLYVKDDVTGIPFALLGDEPTGAMNVVATFSPSGTQDVNLTKVGGTTFALGQQLAASSLPIVLTAAQLSTLTPLTTIPVTNTGTFAVQATLAAETTKVIGTVNQGTSPWVISGAVTTTPTAPTTIYNGKKTVTTAGTRVTLAASQAVKSVVIKALAANTGLIFVGNGSVASTTGFELSAGDSVGLDVANLATVNLDSAVNGEGVSYIATA